MSSVMAVAPRQTTDEGEETQRFCGPTLLVVLGIMPLLIHEREVWGSPLPLVLWHIAVLHLDACITAYGSTKRPCKVVGFGATGTQNRVGNGGIGDLHCLTNVPLIAN